MNMSGIKIDYTRYYQKWHSDTPEHAQAMHAYNEALLSPYLPSSYEASILDVGCGMGFTLMTLRNLGYQNIKGIELDEGQVLFCRQKCLPVEHVEDSAAFLYKNSCSYDLIIVLDVIEHIPHELQLRFVHAIHSALKVSGKLVCTVPNANSALASRWQYNDWTHHISFTEHSLDFLLYNAGFRDIQIHPTEFFRKPRVNFLEIFQKSFWKPLLHWQLFRFVRAMRRAQMVAELGWEQGMSVPLSLNLLAAATKT